jgi:organic hydroperoxide reductase OsmC/OhrA
MPSEHRYEVATRWAGNRGSGTSTYRSYGRETVLSTPGAPDIAGSADRVFHGDAERWNPEELLLAALSECHLLTYLYEAASNGIVVEAYEDAASGEIEVVGDAGRFTSATLRPTVTISAGDPRLALELHESAGRKCFIAASLAFPIRHEPRILVADDPL